MGGQDNTSNTQFKDLCQLKNVNQTEESKEAESKPELEFKKLYLELKDDMVIPKQRNSHTFARDSKNKKSYLFGGANEEGPLADLYEFNEENNEWKQINAPGNSPPATEMHTSHIWYDAE